MTQYHEPRDSDTGSDYAEARRASLDERMTVMELRLGTALWQHAKVKIPRSALVRAALDLSEHVDGKHQRLSTISYGQFYGGQVGVPQDAGQLAAMPHLTEEREQHRGYSGLM